MTNPAHLHSAEGQAELLQTLLSAERAGAKVAGESLRQATDPDQRALLEQVLKGEGDSYRMIAADVNGDTEQYSGPGKEQQPSMISNLINRLLLRQKPDTDDGARSEDQTLERWSQIGRAMLGQHLSDE